MIKKPLTVIKSIYNGVVIEVCSGPISQRFRTRYSSEIELPDRKGSDEEFETWLTSYRNAYPCMVGVLLGQAKCN